ncbi:MAG: tetratricopeptide repeat protein, partial [Granulosicoccaceae bacterium]
MSSFLRYTFFLSLLLSSPFLLASTALEDLEAGTAYLKKQNAPRALEMLRQANDKVEQGEQLANAKYIELRISLATAYLYTGNMPEAENIALALLPKVKNRYGEKSLEYATTLEMVALPRNLSGRYDEALEYYEQLVELHRHINQAPPAYRARILSTKSLIHKELGQFLKALLAEEAALAILLEKSPQGSDAAINSLVQLGYLAGQLGDSEAQLRYLQQQYDMAVNLYGADHADSRRAKEWLDTRQKERQNILAGNDSDALGNFSLDVVNMGRLGFPADEAKNLAKASRQFGADHPLTLTAMAKYADSLTIYGEAEKAITYYRICIERNEAASGELNADIASLYLRLSNAHNNIFTGDKWKTHRPKAIEYSKKAVDAYSKLYGDDHVRTIVALNHHWQFTRFSKENDQASFHLALRTWKAYTDLEKKILPYMSKQQRTGFRQNFSGLQDNFLESAWVISRKIQHENAFGESRYWEQLDKNIKEFEIADSFEEMNAALDKQNKALEAAQKKDAEARKNRDIKRQLVVNRLYDEWINYKGGISAVENSLNIARLNTNNEQHKALIDKLLEKRKKLAKLRSSSDSNSTTRLFAEQKEVSSIQEMLFKEIPSLRLDARFSTTDIVNSLDKNSVFVDFARYSNSEYIVFIVEPTGRVEVRRLTGDIGGYRGAQIQGGMKGGDQINAGIRNIRNNIDGIIDGTVEFEGSDSLLLADLNNLYDAVLLPIEDITSKYETLILSPDGLLTLIPFSILNNKRTGKYLVESHTIRSIPSAREWLRLRNKSTGLRRISSPAIYANPDFNAGSKTVPVQCASKHPNRSAREILLKTFKE